MRRGLSLVAAALVASLLGCGKKGPPLPPLPGSVPRVTDLELVQVGDEVRATFTLPVRPDAAEVDYVTLSVELWQRSAEAISAGLAPEDLPLRELTESARLVAKAQGDELFSVLAQPVPELIARLETPLPSEPQEFALILKTNLRRRGTASPLVPIELLQAPAAPADLELSTTESGVLLAWTAVKPPPPPELREPLEPSAAAGGEARELGAAAPTADEAPPAPDEAAPAPEAEPRTAESAGARVQGRADQMDDEGTDERALPELPEAASAPAPAAKTAKAAATGPKISYEVYRAIGERPIGRQALNARPIAEPSYADRDVAEGVQYRYAVRALLEDGGRKVLSPASEVRSVLFRDEFPPAIPSGLRLILEGSRAVNLLWNPNTEPDLAGYAVYRRRPAGEWTRIDQAPVRSATFVDRQVQPATVYEYAVAAFDGASPPNESAPSEAQAVELPAASAVRP